MSAKEDYQELMRMADEADRAGDEDRARVLVGKARSAKQAWLKGGQEPGPELDVGGATRAFLQGPSFGWSDEAGAAMAAVPAYLNQPERPPYKPRSYGDIYSDIHGGLAAQREDFRKENPVLAPTLEIAGAMTTGVPGVLRSSYPRAAGIAAGEGAVYGAGAAEPGQRGEGAMFGGAIGAPAGVVGRYTQNLFTPHPDAGRTAAIAEQLGIPLYRSDVSHAGQRAEKMAELMPFGRGSVIGARDRQLGEIDRLMTEDVASIDRASGPYVGPEGVNRSLREQMQNRRNQAGTLYDEVAEQSDRMGPIDAPRTREALAEGWLEESGKAPQRRNQGVVELLEGFDEDLYSPDLSFNALRDMRSDANAAIADARRGNTQIGTKGTQHLGRLASQMETELNDIGTARARDAWREADRFYRENVAGMYKNTALSRMLDMETPEQAMKYAMQPGVANNRELSRKLSSSLTPQGRSAMRGVAMRQALEQATDETDRFSPAKFATYISKRQALFSEFFDDDRVRDVARLMRVIQDAPNVGATPRTGFTGALVSQGALPVVGALAGGGAADPATSLGYAGGTFASQALIGMIAAGIANRRITPRQVQNAIVRAAATNTGLARALESIMVQNAPSGTLEE